MQPNYYPTMTIDKVSNLDGARAYRVYPNTTVYLLDQEEPYIYSKTSDAQGNTILRAFSLTEVDLAKIKNKYLTRDDFDEFKKEILETLKGVKENG